MSKVRTTSGYMVLIFRAIHVLQSHLQFFNNLLKGTLIAKIVRKFRLKAVTRLHEAGFGSSLRVEREGEFSNSVRINRPSPFEIFLFYETFLSLFYTSHYLLIK